MFTKDLLFFIHSGNGMNVLPPNGWYLKSSYCYFIFSTRLLFIIIVLKLKNQQYCHQKLKLFIDRCIIMNKTGLLSIPSNLIRNEL